jgi:hypothetical protein
MELWQLMTFFNKLPPESIESLSNVPIENADVEIFFKSVETSGWTQSLNPKNVKNQGLKFEN